MLLVLSADGSSLRLDDAHDFKRLSLSAQGDVSAASVLAEFRKTDDDHVFVPEAKLRALAGELASDPDWRQQFDGMLRFAAKNGWIDEAGGVRVHVEYSE